MRGRSWPAVYGDGGHAKISFEVIETEPSSAVEGPLADPSQLELCSQAVPFRQSSGSLKMFRRLWKKWTLDKPAAFGDLLWEILVVQLAALLDRLTLRQIITFISF